MDQIAANSPGIDRTHADIFHRADHQPWWIRIAANPALNRPGSDEEFLRRDEVRSRCLQGEQRTGEQIIERVSDSTERTIGQGRSYQSGFIGDQSQYREAGSMSFFRRNRGASPAAIESLAKTKVLTESAGTQIARARKVSAELQAHKESNGFSELVESLLEKRR